MAPSVVEEEESSSEEEYDDVDWKEKYLIQVKAQNINSKRLQTALKVFVLKITGSGAFRGKRVHR
jgi:hypothetical protein